MKRKLPGILAAGALITLMGSTPAFAQSPADLKIGMDTMWVLITGSLVFFMNLGFALVESGLCRAKNTVNILSKNFIVFAISCLAFQCVIFPADPLRLSCGCRPDQDTSLTLLESTLQYPDQIVTSGQDDLIQKYLETLLVKHIIKIQNPYSIDGPVR